MIINDYTLGVGYLDIQTRVHEQKTNKLQFIF